MPATAVLTALVLATGVSTILPDLSEKILLIALSAGSVIPGVLAAKDLFMIRQGKLLEDWMTKRAAAESKRLDFFTQWQRPIFPQLKTAFS